MIEIYDWTQERDAELTQYWHDRWDLKWISRKLQTTVDITRNRIKKLDLPPRVKNRASPRGTKNPEATARKCLRCGRGFFAESKFLRLCPDTCRSTGL